MEHRGAPETHGGAFRVLPDARIRRPRCLLTDLHPERGLSSVLRGHLAVELPGIEFTLEPAGELDAVWICGYEPAALPRIGEFRRRFPSTLLLVTSGIRGGGWEQEAIDAGADHALEWPCSMSSLSSLLSHDEPFEDELAN